MKNKKIYHINDRTMKYLTLVQVKRQHKYFGLPGEFKARYPQEIVFPNMEAGRADEFYSTKENMIINLEEESEDVIDATLKKISNYAIFADFMYSGKVYCAILCHKNPKDYKKYYERSPSIYIRLHYYYLSQEELNEKYENLINKIRQKEELSEMEALDIAFVPKFISKDDGPPITESLAKVLKYAKINDKVLKRDVTVILGAMIRKHIQNTEKVNELMEEINRKQTEDEIRIIAREEFADELFEMEQEKQKVEKENMELKKGNMELKKGNMELKKGIGELKQMSDLNSKKARQIINTLSLL